MKILLEVFRRLYFTEIPQTNSEPLRLALESRENITVPKFVTLLDQFLSYRFSSLMWHLLHSLKNTCDSQILMQR